MDGNTYYGIKNALYKYSIIIIIIIIIINLSISPLNLLFRFKDIQHIAERCAIAIYLFM